MKKSGPCNRSAAHLALLAALAVVLPARAEDASKAMATDLFDRGVRKMEAGQCDQPQMLSAATCEEARDAFERAFALYPDGLGALRNLANVERALGRTASAARHFRELARRAPLDKSPARRLWADFARKEAQALRPRIPHLVLTFSGEPPEELRVHVDETRVPKAAWGTRLELDPGTHHIRAEALGHEPFEQSVELREGQDEAIRIRLPVQARAASAHATPKSAKQTEAPRVGAAPVITLGAGVALGGAGLGVGYGAMRKRDQACGDSRYCEPEGLAQGRKLARTSTLLTIAGAAALTAGVVWYVVAKRRARDSATVMPEVSATGASMVVRGSF